MTASTRIVIPTKSAVTIDATSPRATIKDVANLLSGASAGVGQGKGAVLESDATVATDTGVTNPGGTALAGGVLWVFSNDETAAPTLQFGNPAVTQVLPAPSASASPVAYVAAIIAASAAKMRPNLDVDFGSTPYVYTQTAGGIAMDSNIADLLPGDKVVVCGVEFEVAANGSDPRLALPTVFTVGNNLGESNSFESKTNNHPALCGKVIVESFIQWPAGPGISIGSLTAIPQLPFQLSIVSSAVSQLASTNGWVDGAAGGFVEGFGTPLVVFYESNDTQYEDQFSFMVTGMDVDDSVAPIGNLSGFAGTVTDAPPIVTSALRGAVASPAPAHSLHVEITQKAVTSHYIQTAPVSQLFRAGDSRTVTQEVVRLLESCLSGTGLSREIDTITVTVYASSTPGDSLTWTVGSR